MRGPMRIVGRSFELDLRQRLFASCYSFPAIRRLLVDAA